jgi:hypothetical protein
MKKGIKPNIQVAADQRNGAGKSKLNDYHAQILSWQRRGSSYRDIVNKLKSHGIHCALGTLSSFLRRAARRPKFPVETYPRDSIEENVPTYENTGVNIPALPPTDMSKQIIFPPGSRLTRKPKTT